MPDLITQFLLSTKVWFSKKCCVEPNHAISNRISALQYGKEENVVSIHQLQNISDVQSDLEYHELKDMIKTLAVRQKYVDRSISEILNLARKWNSLEERVNKLDANHIADN